MNIDNRDERRFYEIESGQNQWSLSELKRQFNSGIYERLALSRDKNGVKALADKGQIIGNPQDVLKDPYVLEFLGLDENSHYSESDLESAIIDKLETFLLELGKGFLFESRQKRFTFDADHFYVDLVFYNRILRCYVLIDLKIGKLTHENLGQMQMYVNYYNREVKLDDENPTIGMILCKTKNDALVRAHPSGECKHLRFPVSALPALKRGTEEETDRMVRNCIRHAGGHITHDEVQVRCRLPLPGGCHRYRNFMTMATPQ